MAINRIFVHRSIYDEFEEQLTKKVSELPYGDPKDPKNIIGPIINEKQIEKIMNLVETAKQEGATATLEGKRIGNVITPFVFTNVTRSEEHTSELQSRGHLV